MKNRDLFDDQGPLSEVVQTRFGGEEEFGKRKFVNSKKQGEKGEESKPVDKKKLDANNMFTLLPQQE